MTSPDKTLLQKVDQFHWYQSIPLGDGVVTPGETGDAESFKIEKMDLPADMTGKTVIDIGCNEGFYSFEMEKRGAKRVVAVDKSTAARDKLLLVREIFDSKVEFWEEEILSLDPKKIGKFDYLFFLAVFHHLRYPFMVLDRIYDLTREVAVMEFVEAVPNDGAELSALVRKLSKKGHLHILPTRKFMLETVERAGFKDIKIMGTHRAHRIKETRGMPGFSEQRVLIKAYR